MKISIIKNTKSYLPEAYAYQQYLNNLGYKVDITEFKSLDHNTDLIIDFMGLRTKPYKSKNFRYIHEYSSSSVPPFVNVKNFLKKKLNFKPSGRIFLNHKTFKAFNFKDNLPYIYREMGCDKEFFINSNDAKKFQYDLVYSGSISNRTGLVECIIKLLRLNFKILLIGKISKEISKLFDIYSEIDIAGYVDRKYLPDLYKQARAGLNYMPNISPYKFQTSTKTLEYCASNIGVVSSQYYWSKKFSFERNSNFLWLENLNDKKQFDNFSFNKTNVKDLEWSKILDKCNFSNFVHSCMERD